MYTISIHRVRAIPLEPALEPFGAQRAPQDPTRNGRVGGSRIRVRGARFHDHILEAGGGAIDLACHLGGWNFRAAVIWLSGNANRLRRADRVPAATPDPERARSLPPSVPDPDPLARVVGSLTGPGRRAISTTGNGVELRAKMGRRLLVLGSTLCPGFKADQREGDRMPKRLAERLGRRLRRHPPDGAIGRNSNDVRVARRMHTIWGQMSHGLAH